eukprot:951613-Prymnesium_polylepis.1
MEEVGIPKILSKPPPPTPTRRDPSAFFPVASGVPRGVFRRVGSSGQSGGFNPREERLPEPRL